MKANDLYQLIPGYREAVARENTWRDEAFLDAPEFICGIEVRAMTIADFALLHALRSPFITGQEAAAEDVALFLWAVSPDYKLALRVRSAIEVCSARLARLMFGRARRKFVKRLRRLNYGAAVAAIEEYLDRSLADAPKGGGPPGQSYWSMLAGIIGMIALETGWREADIRDLPMKRAFQYLRLFIKRRDPERIMFNQSDSVRSAWLRQINSQPAQNGIP